MEAVDRLERIEDEKAYTALLGSRRRLSERDERFVTEMVAGVTRWRRWLDFLIDEFYNSPSANLAPEVRQILRLGVYELLFLRTPAYAAINEAVELAKSISHRGVVGLVNGLLRTVDRKREDLRVPDTGDAAEDLSIRHSHPTWMVRRWLQRYGREATRRLLTWNNERPSFGIRVNRLNVTPDEFVELLESMDLSARPSSYLNDFVVVDQLQEIFEDNLLSEGLCSVQGQGAGAVVRLANPQPEEFVVDLCSAPGGKTFYMAELMQDRGRILAVDVHARRLNLVAEGARRLGITMADTQHGDARHLHEQEDLPSADRVLLDVPCTGTGVLNTRADLRWRRRAADLEDLTALQDELLDGAAPLVRPGGVLVYSTCSLEPEENEQRVEMFLARHPAFSREEADALVPEVLVDDEGYLRALPHEHQVDGAFGALLRRQS